MRFKKTNFGKKLLKKYCSYVKVSTAHYTWCNYGERLRVPVVPHGVEVFVDDLGQLKEPIEEGDELPLALG